MDTALAIQVENADTEAGAKQASDLVSAVDIRETTVSPQAALDIFRSGKPGMTPQKIWDSTRRLFSAGVRSEEHTSELQSLMRTSYAGFCLNNKTIPSRKRTPLTHL